MMTMNFWNMTIGVELNESINNLPSMLQRRYFQTILAKYNQYVQDNDELISFGEYYNMFEREPPKKKDPE